MKKYGKIYRTMVKSFYTINDSYGSKVRTGLVRVDNECRFVVNVIQNGAEMPSIVLEEKDSFEFGDAYAIIKMCYESIREKGCVNYKHIKWCLSKVTKGE